MIRKCFAEGFGTFVLVFAGTGAIIVNHVSGGAITHPGIALTFGLVVMAMIYAVGDVSGAHFNPAVTLGFFLAQRLPGRFVLPYWVSQLAGGLFASCLLRFLFGNVANLGTTHPAGSDLQSFVLEIILTAIFVFVILCVATGSKEQGLMAGIAIGGTLTLLAMFGGPISGTSVNPARSLAPALVSGHLASLYIYVTAPFIGAAIGVPCWMIAGRKATAVV